MSISTPARTLGIEFVCRELGNWRTSGRSGPAYRGLADALRMLIVDGRLPVGAQLPSERTLAEALRVSRTTVTSAYHQLRDDGYLHARRGARSTIVLPSAPADVPADAPATINLAAAALPTTGAAAMQEAFAAATAQAAGHLQQSGHDLRGIAALRDAIAERYCARGLPTDPEQIMVTSGAQHAIGLIMTTCLRPGDRVLVEQPTYHGALTAIAAADARAVPVPMTDTGWDVDGLHAAVRQLAPSLAYLVPDNQNPTGFTMPAADRDRVTGIIAASRTRVIIDETMTDLWFEKPVPPPLAAFNRAALTAPADLAITVGSMSKSFWAGLRVGWIRAQPSTLAAIRAVRPAVDLGSSVIDQLAAAWLLQRADDMLPARRDILRTRQALLIDLVRRELPDWLPLPGGGGMSLWVRLPAPVSTALCAGASRLGVELPPGPRFGVDGTLERFVRIPYTLPEEQLVEAVRLLGRAWRAVTGTAVTAGPSPVVV
ncbi:PLP-dependent aminotransferase family protein [Mycolicibacterium thermoresistibile]|nr:PLP-dependent aminotransferase family protein [Mycolicibacterium thermoresistibile]MCV7189251.1 PLP-dependent aminotransferase family protein [Mycolicibacterium thermoresistibile]SNW17689.1 transcriptional regulator with HTH domain and aminotransferase domain [Mycolicibacterium thermoresistibile]